MIEWDDGPHAKLTTDDIVAELEQATLKPGAVAQNIGDADKAMASAVTKVEATYQVPFLAHATMEPMNCTVHVRKDGCEIWVGTQAIARVQAAAREGRRPAAGQGRGPQSSDRRRLRPAAGERRRRFAPSRSPSMSTVRSRSSGPARKTSSTTCIGPIGSTGISAGLDEKGMPVAWNNRFAGSSVIARWLPPAFKNGLDPDTTEGAIDLVYDLPNLHVEYVRVEPPGIPTAFWRSVGPSHNVFVTESFMDELAAAAKQDPVAYRLALLDKTPRAKAVLALAAEKAGWGQPLAATGRPRRLPPVRLRDLHGAGRRSRSGEGRRGSRPARRLRGRLRHRRQSRHRPAQIQSAIIFGITAALYGEITLKDGRVEQANFDTYQMLRMNEAPAIEVHIVQSSEPPGGMGEAGTSAIVPAVTNAIFAATGKRLRKLPVDTTALKQPV